ncbi:hypothetical protein PZ895_08330 [Mesorhizobium sp. YIM 152430]|jgi:hypothetical protein|uniref:hypothetical protein n=1 Tax=Mesorhizobium sp. YIM 152430 TaxID=3031761 RepID=UPI0023D9ACDA|nr:hypothetical protein [Mesorhizobium sp. YIM 152430]MDF1599782.1 hypothetical protein [Mesorhizobium sp. YIM 152430]
MLLLGFHALAAAHGDGLHPELRALMEARRAMESDTRIADLVGWRGEIVQAGPNPAPLPGAFRPGNVIDFKPRTAQVACDADNAETAKGQV